MHHLLPPPSMLLLRRDQRSGNLTFNSLHFGAHAIDLNVESRNVVKKYCFPIW